MQKLVLRGLVCSLNTSAVLIFSRQEMVEQENTGAGGMLRDEYS